MSTDKNLEKIIQEAVGNVLGSTVKIQKPVKEIIKTVKNIISEAVILMPRSFVLKTDVQSPTTKENHEKLYKSYVDSFNKISSKLDSVSKQDAENPNDSEFRRLKIDENHNMNGAKFHELYFMNIGDLNSEIRADSIPFMRLSRDWGTFDQWQLDFRACGMAATEGWAICYFDPFKQRYFNCFVEKHNMYIPLMGIPVIVMDTWHHAWFYDYPGEKMEYLNKSMRELNWDVIEMRMLASEMSKLNQIYAIQPVISNKKEDRGITLGSNTPPLEVTAGKI
jgi:Fe-Mn family superoxide dismutase